MITEEYNEDQSYDANAESYQLDADYKYDKNTYKFENYFVEPGKYVEGFNVKDLLEADLKTPINPLDPVVYHDPAAAQPFVVKFKNTIGSIDGFTNMTPDEDNQLIEGIVVPVVRLNTAVLSKENIVGLTIVTTGFLPELTLIVKDSAGLNNFKVQPGLNNIVQVVICPAIDGKYKKITLSFYITDVDVDIEGTQITYTGVLKYMPLLQHLSDPSSVLYTGCESGVAKSEKCITNPTSLPNMWELFHEIAKRTGLGFAAMKGLKEYKDNIVRNIETHNYKELLEYNLSIGGVDETMIYDGWVDIYGYLVLVDIYKALHDDVSAENLAMYAETGLHTHALSSKDNKYEKFKPVRRVLTNSNAVSAYSNVEIEEFYNTSQIGKVIEHGTLNTIFFFCPFGNNGINNLNAEQIRIKEESRDGQFVEDYEVQHYCGWSFVGCEQMNTARQMEIRNAYLTKLRNTSVCLTVRLTRPNYALQRGTLVTIVRMNYDYRYKMKLLNSESNIYADPEERGYLPDIPSINDGVTNNDLLENDGLGVTSPEDSGIYYIDGIRYDYIAGNETIQQYLYLIRKGPILSMDNRSTMAKFKYPLS